MRDGHPDVPTASGPPTSADRIALDGLADVTESDVETGSAIDGVGVRPSTASTEPPSLSAGARPATQQRLASLWTGTDLTDASQPADPQIISRSLILIGRLAVLALVTVLGWLATGSPWIFAFTGALIVAALPTLWVPLPAGLIEVGRAAEVVITCLGADFAVRYAHPGMFA